MVDALLLTRRPQGIGAVLDGGLRLFRASVLHSLPYAAVAALAGQLPAAYDVAAGRPLRGFGSSDPLWWVVYVLATGLSFVMWSAVMLRQQRIVEGRRAGTVAELRDACRRLPAMVALVAPLGVGLLAAAQLGGTARLILAVPAIWLGTALSMSWPLLLVECRSPFGAYGGSVALVAGHWWRTAALLAASAVILIVFYALGGVIGALATAPPGGSAGMVVLITMLKSVVLLLFGSLAVPLYSALLLATYHDLKGSP